MTFKVYIIESDSFTGSKIDEIKEFDTHEEALGFVQEYNSFNDKNSKNFAKVPDWYMYAELA